ncbi:MAG: hypothetical protein IJT27_05050 [Clostridia bacterium]|nr:hypothetical protein [Clostridia bacterium]
MDTTETDINKKQKKRKGFKKTRKLKAIFSILLAALTAAGFTAAAFAASDGVILSGNAGESVTWSLTGGSP